MALGLFCALPLERLKKFVALVLICIGFSMAEAAETAAINLKSFSNEADAVMSHMTLEEKIGQTVLLTGYGATTGPVREQTALEDYIRTGECGNVFNVLGVAQIRRLQKIAVKETRLKIPLLFGFDTIHGYRTIFPFLWVNRLLGIWN